MEVEVNIFLDNIANQFKGNKLTLNVKKSNLLVFNSRKKCKEKPLLRLFIDNEIKIEITNFRKGLVLKLCKYVQEETMKNLFISFLKPYTEYGKLAWGGTPKTKIELRNRNINHSIRTIMDMDKFDSVKAFYEYLKILPFKDNMKLLQ